VSVLQQRPRRQLFWVIGAQRTGTTLLREILNSNGKLMMVAEVLLPYPDRFHWEHFVGALPAKALNVEDEQAGFALLDSYFAYLHSEMTERWNEPHKTGAIAFGIDVKLDQLRFIEPAGWPSDAVPFMLHYAMVRNVMLINTVRRNVIQCAVSSLLAEKRNYWHNYEARDFDRAYEIDVHECLARARAIVEYQHAFEESTRDYPVQRCDYEDLAEAAARCGDDLCKLPGPLSGIADAFGIPRRFFFHGRLRRAVNKPYQDIISNYADLVGAISLSEFADLARAM